MSTAPLDPISTLQSAITARLREYFTGKWTIEAVPAPLTLGEFRSLTGSTPWIGISWTEFAPDAGATRSLKGRVTFRLTICVKHPGRAGRFAGDRLAPGLYGSSSTAAIVLHGHTVDGWGTLLVTRAAQVFADGYADDTIAIAALDVACDTAFGDWRGDAAAAPAFARLVSEFELQAGDTTRPIATDTTELES